MNIIMVKWNKENNLKVHRTTEGNLFELAAAVIVVLMWIFTISHIQDINTSHSLTNTGKEALITSIIGTAVVGLCLVSAYFPDRMINIPFIKTKTTAQYELIIRMVRIIAIEIAMTCMLTVIDTGEQYKIYTNVLCIALAITCVTFMILIKRKI